MNKGIGMGCKKGRKPGERNVVKDHVPLPALVLYGSSWTSSSINNPRSVTSALIILLQVYTCVNGLNLAVVWTLMLKLRYNYLAFLIPRLSSSTKADIQAYPYIGLKGVTIIITELEY